MTNTERLFRAGFVAAERGRRSAWLADRPMLTAEALRRWLPALLLRAPCLVSAYLVPGRVSPRLREATMLGVTSVNRCTACDRVHQQWARTTGLATDNLTPDEAAAYAYGQAMAATAPDTVHGLPGLGARHRRELETVAIAIELANLGGNRFLPERRAALRLQIGRRWTAQVYDVVMRMADRVGVDRARRRVAGRASGAVLEIGIGTGLNLNVYPASVSLCGIDPSDHGLRIAATRADRLGHDVTLQRGDAATMPYPDASFDTVVGTFVLCSVGDVHATLLEIRRVLRPGGSVRFLEHARSGHSLVARIQDRVAPGWATLSGGCRLDHDVRSSIEAAGLSITEERSHGGGLLVEIIAANPVRSSARSGSCQDQLGSFWRSAHPSLLQGSQDD